MGATPQPLSPLAAHRALPNFPNIRSMPSLSVKGDLTFGWDRPCVCRMLTSALCTRVLILSFCEFMKDKHTESSCSVGLGCSLQL